MGKLIELMNSNNFVYYLSGKTLKLLNTCHLFTGKYYTDLSKAGFSNINVHFSK